MLILIRYLTMVTSCSGNLPMLMSLSNEDSNPLKRWRLCENFDVCLLFQSPLLFFPSSSPYVLRNLFFSFKMNWRLLILSKLYSARKIEALPGGLLDRISCDASLNLKKEEKLKWLTQKKRELAIYTVSILMLKSPLAKNIFFNAKSA